LSRARHAPLPTALLVVASALLLAACGTEEAAPSVPLGPDRAIVTYIIDGDTLVVEASGDEERVRLIGIDTPEVEHSDLAAECFGPEATAALTALLPEGTEVRLERDVEPRDRFDRLLAYVFRAEDDLFVNVAMAETGYADSLTIEPNVAYRQQVAAAVAVAKTQGLGLWGACDTSPQ
jgi:micrococcal nuclease